jgi:hypothetical protein
MFISLEQPGDKQVTIIFRDLQGDADYEPWLGNTAWDSERSRADLAVPETNEELGRDLGRIAAFHTLFHQVDSRGITGWEYWSRDYVLVLRHALKVAEKLGATLHIHQDVMPKLLVQLSINEITFDMETADTKQVFHNVDETYYISKKLEAGEYFVLSNVAFPALPT